MIDSSTRNIWKLIIVTATMTTLSARSEKWFTYLRSSLLFSSAWWDSQDPGNFTQFYIYLVLWERKEGKQLLGSLSSRVRNIYFWVMDNSHGFLHNSKFESFVFSRFFLHLRLYQSLFVTLDRHSPLCSPNKIANFHSIDRVIGDRCRLMQLIIWNI